MIKREDNIQKLLDNMTKQMFGRVQDNIHCTNCGKDAGFFKDEVSLREYEISGLCQECQDKVFDENEYDDGEGV